MYYIMLYYIILKYGIVYHIILLRAPVGAERLSIRAATRPL